MTEKYGQARYNALNLHSFFYRQTVEFRHHQGTTNAVKATSWGMLCASILDAAQRLSMREINDIIARYSDTPHAALIEIAAHNNPKLAQWVDTRREHFTNRY
jgi:hypothetical protein